MNLVKRVSAAIHRVHPAQTVPRPAEPVAQDPLNVPVKVSPPTATVVAKILGHGSATIIDVGARWGVADSWFRIAPLARSIGFDPDPVECARLNGLLSADSLERYVPLGLWEKACTASLNVTEEPACSSLFSPVQELTERYPDLQAMRTVKTVPVNVDSLNNWSARENVREVSFIKLDTQGAELSILRGADRLLPHCMGCDVEVQFTPLYEGVPVFAEVDTYLRSHGFTLWRFSSMCHYAESQSGQATSAESHYYGGRQSTSTIGSGRLTWANAIYFRDFYHQEVTPQSTPRLLVLASLLSAAGDLSAAQACLGAILASQSNGLNAAAKESLLSHQKLLQSLI